jgi:hypothetical protein
MEVMLVKNKFNERDQAVLDALEENIKIAPKIGVCADTFYALKQEFLRIMQERDEAIKELQEATHHEV